MSVREFLRAIDDAWSPRPAQKLTLRVIGSTALMLQSNYARGTKDSDIVQTDSVTPQIADQLVALAGPNTKLFQRFRMYIQVVNSAILFKRQTVAWCTPSGLEDLRSFHVEAMSIVDVVVSKLKRFDANDRDDIAAMIDRELVSHEELVACFRQAVDFTDDAKSDRLPQWIANLHRVERDSFGIDVPTEIELPSWVDDGT